MRRTLLLASVLVACSRRPPEPHPSITADPASTASAAKPSASPPPAACERDKDCEYDDPCNAKTCVRASARPFAGCGESSPPPGSCACVAGVCTMRRRGAPRGTPATGCKSPEDCAFDEATGVCGPGAGTNVQDEGIFCACVDRGCVPGFAPRVPCKTSDDCSATPDPWHPVSSAKVPRPKGKPCWDYSHTAECHEGLCRVVVLKC